jgi:hypothetical protein
MVSVTGIGMVGTAISSIPEAAVEACRRLRIKRGQERRASALSGKASQAVIWELPVEAFEVAL